MDKQKTWLIVGVGILILIILVVVGVVFNEKDEPSYDDTTTLTTTVVTSIISEEELTTAASPGELIGEDEEIYDYIVKNENGQYVLYEGENQARFFSTLLKIKIPELSENEQYYYFTNGVYDPSYQGIAEVSDDQIYWAANGTWDQSYAGIVEHNGYRWIMTDGRVRFDLTGKVKVNNMQYQVENGIIVD